MSVEELCRRADACWVGLDGRPQRVVWHLWHDDALWLVTGGAEQDLPGAATATTATVTVRTKAAQDDRVLTWHATATQMAPGSAEWEAVVPLLHAARLHPPDGEEQPRRWARESVVLRLSP